MDESFPPLQIEKTKRILLQSNNKGNIQIRNSVVQAPRILSTEPSRGKAVAIQRLQEAKQRQRNNDKYTPLIKVKNTLHKHLAKTLQNY